MTQPLASSQWDHEMMGRWLGRVMMSLPPFSPALFDRMPHPNSLNDFHWLENKMSIIHIRKFIPACFGLSWSWWPGSSLSIELCDATSWE
jgi:hypothetical protein